jgi:hypothetical protein
MVKTRGTSGQGSENPDGGPVGSLRKSRGKANAKVPLAVSRQQKKKLLQLCLEDIQINKLTKTRQSAVRAGPSTAAGARRRASRASGARPQSGSRQSGSRRLPRPRPAPLRAARCRARGGPRRSRCATDQQSADLGRDDGNSNETVSETSSDTTSSASED